MSLPILLSSSAAHPTCQQEPKLYEQPNKQIIGQCSEYNLQNTILTKKKKFVSESINKKMFLNNSSYINMFQIQINNVSSNISKDCLRQAQNNPKCSKPNTVSSTHPWLKQNGTQPKMHMLWLRI